MDFMKIMHRFGSGGRSDAALPAGSTATWAGLVCKYCKGTKFYSGPEGCGSTNILCANPECRHWFCDIGIPGQPLMDLKRVEPTESEHTANNERRKTIELGRRASVALEGFDAHKMGSRAFPILTNAPYGGGAAHPDNLDRLAGYIDSMNGQPRWLLEQVAQTGYAAQTEEDALKAQQTQ